MASYLENFSKITFVVFENGTDTLTADRARRRVIAASDPLYREGMIAVTVLPRKPSDTGKTIQVIDLEPKYGKSIEAISLDVKVLSEHFGVPVSFAFNKGITLVVQPNDSLAAIEFAYNKLFAARSLDAPPVRAEVRRAHEPGFPIATAA